MSIFNIGSAPNDGTGDTLRATGQKLNAKHSVLSQVTDTPVSPTEGDFYIVPAAATGAFAGQDGDLAWYNGTSWEFYTPSEGILVWVSDENKNFQYSGLAWEELVTGSTGGGAGSGGDLEIVSAEWERVAWAPATGGASVDFDFTDNADELMFNIVAASTDVAGFISVQVKSGGSVVAGASDYYANSVSGATEAAGFSDSLTFGDASDTGDHIGRIVFSALQGPNRASFDLTAGLDPSNAVHRQGWINSGEVDGIRFSASAGVLDAFTVEVYRRKRVVVSPSNAPVYMAAGLTGDLALTVGAASTLIFDEELEDTTEIHDTSTGIVTIPASMDQNVVTFSVGTQHTADGASSLELFLERFAAGGSGWSRVAQSDNVGTDFFGICSVNTTLRVAAGDQFRVQYFSGGAKTLERRNSTYLRVATVISKVDANLTLGSTAAIGWRARPTADQALLSGGFERINFDSVTGSDKFDTDLQFDTANNRWVVPASLDGRMVTAQAGIRTTVANLEYLIYIYQRDLVGTTKAVTLGSVDNFNVGNSVLGPVLVAEGDYFEVFVFADGNALTVDASSFATFFSGYVIPETGVVNPAAISFGGFRADKTGASAQVLGAVQEKALFENEVFDEGGGYDPVTSLYTVPAEFDGEYMVFEAGLNLTSYEVMELGFSLNAALEVYSNVTTSARPQVSSGPIQVTAGDTIEVTVRAGTGAPSSQAGKFSWFGGYVIRGGQTVNVSGGGSSDVQDVEDLGDTSYDPSSVGTQDINRPLGLVQVTPTPLFGLLPALTSRPLGGGVDILADVDFGVAPASEVLVTDVDKYESIIVMAKGFSGQDNWFYSLSTDGGSADAAHDFYRSRRLDDNGTVTTTHENVASTIRTFMSISGPDAKMTVEFKGLNTGLDLLSVHSECARPAANYQYVAQTVHQLAGVNAIRFVSSASLNATAGIFQVYGVKQNIQPLALNFDYQGSPGGPLTLARLVIPYNVRLIQGATGSFKVGLNPAGTESVDINQNGTPIGDLSIDSGGVVTVTVDNDIDLVLGDEITLSVDGARTFTDVYGALQGQVIE